MAQFKVTYSDGSKTLETASDCNSVEQFLNTRFGSSSGLDKVKVEMVGAEPESPVIKSGRK